MYCKTLLPSQENKDFSHDQYHIILYNNSGTEGATIAQLVQQLATG
jgi:hypothetical protein